MEKWSKKKEIQTSIFNYSWTRRKGFSDKCFSVEILMRKNIDEDSAGSHVRRC
jgi:hypothetical protein